MGPTDAVAPCRCDSEFHLIKPAVFSLGNRHTVHFFAHTPEIFMASRSLPRHPVSRAAAKRAGARILYRRESLGLRRPDVAKALGYTNLSRGSSRLASWEQGVPLPGERLAALAQSLQLSPETLRSWLEEAQEVDQRVRLSGWRTIVATRDLLARHTGRLRARSEALLSRPELAHVRPVPARLSLLWIGGGTWSLGELVTAWAEGGLVTEIDGEPVWVFSGAGSPLSGSGRCTGVDRHGQLHDIKNSPTHLRGLLRPGNERSSWSLGDVIADLGGEVPPCTIIPLDEQVRDIGTPLATYDFHQHALLDRTGQAVWRLEDSSQQEASHRPTDSGVSIGGGPRRSVKLAEGINLGAYTGDVVHSTCGLRLVEGRVEAARGRIPVRLDGPTLPIGTLSAIQRLLETT